MNESELYEPVKRLFEAEGYAVKGEIKNCDMMCEKEDEFIICELKCSLNLELILQGATRQRICDLVYVCVPQKKRTRTAKKQRQLYDLLRRLNLGLIYVHFGKGSAVARVAIEAKPAGLKQNRTLQARTKTEFKNRVSENIGGVNRVKIVTCYRENAVLLAALLRQSGEAMRPRDLVAQGADKNAATIMRNNVYGWFRHEARGLYSLTKLGANQLSEYEDLVPILMEKKVKK